MSQFDYSVICSVLFIVIYLAGACLHRQTPDLSHVVIITTACSSTVAAVFLGVMTYAATPDQLGILREHKASVMTGAVALIWVSLASACNSLLHPWRRAR